MAFNFTDGPSLVIVALLLIILILGYLLTTRIREAIACKQLMVRATNQLDAYNEQLQKHRENYESTLKFLSIVCQDLQAPLMLILTPVSDLLTNPANHSSQNQELKLVEKNAFVLLRKVNQLLDWQKIEGGQFTIRAHECDLLEVVNQVLKPFHELATERQVKLDVITQQEIRVWTDVHVLAKILHNLLYQAFKTSQSGAQVSIRILRSPPDDEITIIILDTGTGLTPEELAFTDRILNDKILLNYTDPDANLTWLVVKKLVDLLHCKMTLTSAQWKGTSVRISFPVGKIALAANQAEKSETNVLISGVEPYTADLQSLIGYMPVLSEHAPTKNNSILLIEKEQGLATYLTEKLRPSYEILSADTGLNGIQLALGNVPDLIICDQQLPDRNGLEIIHILKSDFKTSHIPIILLSTDALADHNKSGFKGRADIQLTKPFRLATLKESVKTLLKERVSFKDHFSPESMNGLEEPLLNRFDKKFIGDFSAIVENNIANEHFTVEDICRGIGVSKIQLYRKVKALFEVSVNEYIINVRLQKATYLLKSEAIPIAEVAVLVGFSSAAYFSTVFKSKLQMTPKQYKTKFNS